MVNIVFEPPEPFVNAFIRGLRAGVGRATLAGMLTDDLFGLSEAVTMAVAAIERTQPDYHLSPHGVELFGELVGVAITARLAHGEEPLSVEDISRFLPAAAMFLNTFFCPPPT